MDNIYIGIDPGKNGGIAVIMNGHIEAIRMPKIEYEIYEQLLNYKQYGEIKICLLEKVHSMPNQGVRSTFTFGQHYGFLRGCLTSLKIPFDDISPSKWQRALGCLTKGNKKITKQKAQQLYPVIKVTHYIADAILIAHYAKYFYGGKK